jgi:hypothetical protein
VSRGPKRRNSWAWSGLLWVGGSLPGGGGVFGQVSREPGHRDEGWIAAPLSVERRSAGSERSCVTSDLFFAPERGGSWTWPSAWERWSPGRFLHCPGRFLHCPGRFLHCPGRKFLRPGQPLPRPDRRFLRPDPKFLRPDRKFLRPGRNSCVPGTVSPPLAVEAARPGQPRPRANSAILARCPQISGSWSVSPASQTAIGHPGRLFPPAGRLPPPCWPSIPAFCPAIPA